jgi:hypothetical protein
MSPPRSPRSQWYYYHSFRHNSAKEIANRFAANGSIARVKNGIRLWENSLRRSTPQYVGGRSEFETKQAKLILRYLKMHLNRLERAKHVFGVWHAESMMRRLKKNFNSVRR